MYRNLPKKLTEYRKTYNLTQVDMALRLSCSLMSYRLWETGVTKPNPENIKRIDSLLQS